MLPSIENIDDLISINEYEQENTQTFYLNMNDNTISGMIDELEALKQNIYLMLSIEADQYIIYPYTYGFKSIDLIGKPSYYVIAVLPDRIKDTLLSDDRITDVSNFEFSIDKNKITVKFVVDTIYGDVNAETEVVI